MSVEAITWALKQPVKHSSAKFVLVALANCADGANGRAWPSVAYLCEATSQDRKTVLANLKRLIDTGFIQDTGARMGSTKSVVVYQICSPEIVTPKQSQERNSLEVEAVPFFPPSSTVFPHKQSQNSLEAVPKTGHGTVRNRNRTVNEINTELLSQLPAALVSDFLQIRKAKKLPLTQTAVDGIQREADKAGVSLEEAVRLCCEYGWGSFNAGWHAQRNGTAAKPAKQAKSFAQQEREAGWARWEEQTNRIHPDRMKAEQAEARQGFEQVIDVTPTFLEIKQ